MNKEIVSGFKRQAMNWLYSPAVFLILLLLQSSILPQTITLAPANKTLITKAKSVGVNIEMNAVDDAMWNSNGKWMKEIFSAAGIKNMRWGYGAWNWDWQKEQPLCFDFMSQYNTHDANGSLGLMEFIDYCIESNTTPLIMMPVTVEQYPQHTWDDIQTLITNLAAYVKSRGLTNVYFELGNEPGFRLSAAVYLSRLSDIYPKIKSINSSFRVVASVTGFNEDSLRTGSAYFDAIDHHKYEPLNFWGGYFNKNDDNLSSPSPVIGTTEEILGECNVLFPDWNGYMARDLQSSLPLLNVLLNAITLNRASFIASWPSHWARLKGVPSYGIFDYDSWEKFHKMKLFTGPLLAHKITNDAVLDYTVPVSISDEKIRAFCFSDAAGSKINLVVINKNSTASSISISLGQKMDYVNVFEFKGSSLTDIAPEFTNSLANQQVNSTAFSYNLPPQSAVVFQFLNDMSTQKPQSFAAASPLNNEADVSTYKNFIWQKNNDVNYYELKISDKADFSNIILDIVTGNTSHAESLTPLEAGRTYYWNVTAFNKNGSTQMSSVPLTFTTAAPVEMPQFTAEVKNGNFEDYTGWYGWSDDVTLTTNPIDVHSGHAALSLGLTSIGLNQYMRGFLPGKEYSFSISSKFTDIRDSVYFVIESRDSTEAVIKSQGALLIPHTSYHDTTLSFTMPEGIFRNNISFWKASANKGRVYIDDLTLGILLPVEKKTFTVPEVLSLEQNYPNPFNPATTLKFTVPAAAITTLKVYNILGQEVATLFNGIAEAGKYYQAVFNGSNLTSGIYFAQLQYSSNSIVKKLLLIK